MKTSDKGIELIADHEGLRLKAYKCPAGVWTIGYGHTGGIVQGQTISKQQAVEFLKQDLRVSEKAVNKKGLNINQNQFDALVSFIFNVGSGAFGRSTLLKKVRINPNDLSIVSEFAKWNKARVNGVLTVLPGLTKRRKAESNLYFNKTV